MAHGSCRRNTSSRRQFVSRILPLFKRTGAPERTACRCPRVLVIDDDAAIREMVALTLEKSGFQAIRRSLQEARKELHSRRPDLVVCDIYIWR